MKTGDLIDKPWGWERLLDVNEYYVVKHIFIRQDQRLSLQYHEKKRETMFLVSGTAELTRRGPDGVDRTISMETGETYVVETGTVHRLRGTSADGALVLEMSTPELDDVVRLEDDYGR